MTEEKKSEGEVKKRIEQYGLLTIRIHEKEYMEKDRKGIIWVLVKIRDVDAVIKDAKKELLSTVHENCWWSTEAGCHAPNWFIYHQQPEDCPKRRLEKWFGT